MLVYVILKEVYFIPVLVFTSFSLLLYVKVAYISKQIKQFSVRNLYFTHFQLYLKLFSLEILYTNFLIS